MSSYQTLSIVMLMKNALSFFKTPIFEGCFSKHRSNVPFCNDIRCCLYFLEYALEFLELSSMLLNLTKFNNLFWMKKTLIYYKIQPFFYLQTVNYLLKEKVFFLLFILIGIHSKQGWTATTRHGVTRKRNTERLRHTGNLFRKNLQLKDLSILELKPFTS